MIVSNKITITLLVTFTLILIGWDIYAAISPPTGDTISEVVLAFARRHPVFAFAIGVVCGHLTWPQRIKEDGK